jgi:DMSO/TMAO reductase YedYZ molybdopterin-dependent catalytic subunit
MAIETRGFRGRRRDTDDRLPPGQYSIDGFPVLSAGPTPRVTSEDWRFTITTEAGTTYEWTWNELMALPAERPVVDIHCVTSWSKLGTRWEGVSLDALMANVATTADNALVECYGGYTTNLPMADLLGGKAWIAYGYDNDPLRPEHGGPARLLVPHLYFWKSAKWVRGLKLQDHKELGFWETLGYHEYGDPWREQRYVGD